LVAVGDLNGDAAQAVAAGLPGAGLGVRLDVTDRDSTDTAVSRVEAELGPVDVLVNNAGVSSVVPFLDITDADWDRLLNVNLRGVLVVSQRVRSPRRAGCGLGSPAGAGSTGSQPFLGGQSRRADA
jgi:NAD(P)-dependent dehydrogenase (short-subunit alcohol dehydrogenase family)